MSTYIFTKLARQPSKNENATQYNRAAFSSLGLSGEPRIGVLSRFSVRLGAVVGLDCVMDGEPFGPQMS
jgi:hypothetical protein